MKTKKRILVFVILSGVCLHLGAIFWIHHHPLIGGFQKLNRADYLGGRFFQRIKRNQQLSEIFTPVEETYRPEASQPPAPKAMVTPEFVLNEEEELAFLRQGSDFRFEALQNEDTWVTENPFLETPPRPMALMTLSPPQVELPLAESSHLNLKDVSVTVQYAPRRFRPGYVFKLTMTPKPEAPFVSLPKHYVFVLDRSQAIPRMRYYHNRKAVSEALSLLEPRDTFNIFVIDHRITRFSETSLPSGPATHAAAREFLERQLHGGVFSASDLCISLGKILSHTNDPSRVTTLVLLSDGTTYLSAERQRETMRQWMHNHQDKIVLFPIVSGQGTHLPLLDLLSTFNRGAVIYAGHYQEVGKQLSDLITSIKQPIGRELVATALTEDKQMMIQLEPSPARLPLLYWQRPLVLWGTTNRLSDFTLFLQGSDGETHFDIKKTISFADAHGGTLSLERQWTELLSHEYYQMYFDDGKQGHLEAARKLLTPLNLPVPLP